MPVQSVTHEPNWITVKYTDGHCQTYLAAWLRDNIGTGRHAAQGQRTFDLNLMDEVFIEKVRSSQDQVHVHFNHEAVEHCFDEAWLRTFSNQGSGLSDQALWDAKLQSKLRFFDFKVISVDDAALFEALSYANQFGFVLIKNVPGESEALFKVVDLFGYVRQTNYGRSSYKQGARHLQGCYADKDALKSKLRILEAAQ